MPLPTKEHLAQALHGVGLLDLEQRARMGRYDDFESESATPLHDLVRDLEFAKRRSTTPAWTIDVINGLIARVKAGAFDGTKEEGEAWCQREGQHPFPTKRGSDENQ